MDFSRCMSISFFGIRHKAGPLKQLVDLRLLRVEHDAAGVCDIISAQRRRLRRELWRPRPREQSLQRRLERVASEHDKVEAFGCERNERETICARGRFDPQSDVRVSVANDRREFRFRVGRAGQPVERLGTNAGLP